MSVAIVEQFIAAMATRNLSPSRGKDLIADSQWHRCDTAKGTDNGSYRLSLDGPTPWGFYKNWQDGEGVSCWRGDHGRELTETERAELEQRQAQARAEHDKLAAELAAAAAKKAQTAYTLIANNLTDQDSRVCLSSLC